MDNTTVSNHFTVGNIRFNPNGKKDISNFQPPEIVNTRHNDYGNFHENWKNIAEEWSLILGIKVTPIKAVECMIAMKKVRQEFKPKQDNLDDIEGYNYIHNELLKADAKR